MKNSASRKIAAAAGLTLLGLTGMFNSAALAWEDRPGEPRMAQAAVTPAPAPTLPAPVTDADKKLIEQTSALGKLIEESFTKDRAYNPENDAAVQTQVDAIIATLKGGANGNIFAGPDGQAMMGASSLSAFSSGVLIATQAGRPELVDAFVAAGAVAKQLAPDTFMPMDYAIMDFMQGQAMSRTMAENAFAVIQRLEAAGARTGDAKNVSLDGKMKLTIADYNGLAKTFLGRDVLEKAGIKLTLTVDEILSGPPAVRTDLADEPRLTRAFVQNNGGLLVQQDYSEAYPGGPEIYPVQKGDTLASIAARFYVVMGQRSPLHGLSALMKINDLDAHAPLQPGKSIKIPKPITVQIVTPQFQKDVTIRDALKELDAANTYYIPNTSEDDMIRAIARVNGVNEADALSDKFVLKAGTALVMLHRNDSYDFLPKLTPPPYADPSRRVELVVIEAAEGETYHQKRTYGAATSANYAVNNDVDFTRFYAWKEQFLSWPVPLMGGGPEISNSLRALLTDPNNPLRDRLIFTQSMEITMAEAPPPKSDFLDKVRQDGTQENVTVETMRIAIQALEKGGPIVFQAAGNQYANGEGPYKQSFPAVHGPHTYVIGAAGKYNANIDGTLEAAYIMSHYSTGGADICAPLPTFLFEQQEGTSFSTPLMAGLTRQESEWFGDRLSIEEMMAAAMMTANRNVLDYDNPTFVGQSIFPAQYNAHVAKFNTNGAGLPYHARCGAGVLDIVKWHDTLMTMVELKAQPDVNGQELSQTLKIGDAVQTPDADGKGPYVYRVAVPADMTLGKLTFLIPQYYQEHSDITVKSPSGFATVMPRGMFHAVSSHAFAYEDVKAGQFIEITSDKRIAPNAEITVRGYTGVNATAKLRDVLLANGTLPAPLTTIGGQQATYPLPVAPTNAIVGDKIAVPEAIGVTPEEADPQTPQGNTPIGQKLFPSPR